MSPHHKEGMVNNHNAKPTSQRQKTSLCLRIDTLETYPLTQRLTSRFQNRYDKCDWRPNAINCISSSRRPSVAASAARLSLFTRMSTLTRPISFHLYKAHWKTMLRRFWCFWTLVIAVMNADTKAGHWRMRNCAMYSSCVCRSDYENIFQRWFYHHLQLQSTRVSLLRNDDKAIGFSCDTSFTFVEFKRTISPSKYAETVSLLCLRSLHCG